MHPINFPLLKLSRMRVGLPCKIRTSTILTERGFHSPVIEESPDPVTWTIRHLIANSYNPTGTGTAHMYEHDAAPKNQSQRK